jgi:methionyl-tRNA synthetase
VARFYLTTAIDYSNGDPHIGHAYERIGADAIARYRRLRGDDVHFLIGMDEHGIKVSQTAADRGIAPQQLVDEVAAIFQAMWKKLSISNDQFIRTTNEHHRKGVLALINRIFERNPDDFFERSYEGWYCVGCELFKRETEIIAGRCHIHPSRTLQWTVERNWFFRLSRYQKFIRGLIEENPDFLSPASRRNEIIGLLDGGLEDISVTRSRLAWAIPFPKPSSTGEPQGVWVWFDALPNYLTATGFPDPGYETRWPADLHIVGKDITRLHAVIWPAMLKAAELPMPRRVWAHGFVLFGGERFSKSAGVTFDVNDAIDKFGADAFRYFMLREVPFDGDGTFSWERFEERYVSDLANAWGNLASRTLAMVEKYYGGTVPAAPETDVDRAQLAELDDYHSAMDGSRGYLLHEALRTVWQSVARSNEFVQSSAPWALAKDPTRRKELDAVMASLVRQLARQAVCIFPFMPGKSSSLWSRLGAPGTLEDIRFSEVAALDPAGWQVQKGEPLFPKPDAAA